MATPGKTGNTKGRVSGETGKGASAKEANPVVKAQTPKEKSWWDNWGETVHTVLDVGGAIPVVGIFSDAINAGIYGAEGNYVQAAISGASAAANLIPGGGLAAKGTKLAVKAGEKAIAKAVVKETAKEIAEKAAKEAAEKAAKEAAEKAAKEAAEAEAKAAGKAKPKDTKVKPKGKLKCGQGGKYGDLKKQTGDNKFDRDHIPSKAALEEQAKALLGRNLSAAERTAIEKAGNAIAIPKQAHRDISPTNGQSRASANIDSKDLAGSAKRDVDAMLKEIDKYDADGGCRKAYKQAAAKVLRMNNSDYNKLILKALGKW